MRQQCLAINRRLAEASAQSIVVRAEAVKLRIHRIEVGQIAHTQRTAAHLVFIGRADPAARGSDLAGAGRGFAQAIEITVKRQDQRAVVGNREVFGVDADPLGGELLDLCLERPGIEHHAIADDRERAGDNAGREQAELVDLIADHERVPGIVPALEAHDHIGTAGEPVDDLALALIAPLGTDHGHIGHVSRTLCCSFKSVGALGECGGKGKAKRKGGPDAPPGR